MADNRTIYYLSSQGSIETGIWAGMRAVAQATNLSSLQSLVESESFYYDMTGKKHKINRLSKCIEEYNILVKRTKCNETEKKKLLKRLDELNYNYQTDEAEIDYIKTGVISKFKGTIDKDKQHTVTSDEFDLKIYCLKDERL